MILLIICVISHWLEGEHPKKRAAPVKHEQLPRKETKSLRERHVGKSCRLFFGSDPLKIVRARGQYMYTEQGEEFLDCINNVCHVGHCHPHVVRAGQAQMEILNTNSRFLHDNIVLYAQRLAATFPAPLDTVFFVNSGSEANDLALRIARAHTGNEKVLTLEHAYHGNLTSLMAISPYKFNQAGGGGCPKDTVVLPVADTYRGKYTDIDGTPEEVLSRQYSDEAKQACEQLKSQGVRPCCFISESLQSCGGQVAYPRGYLSAVYAHVREAGGVCIADEIQVGFGRVGRHWWGFQTQGVVPDIVTLGKPMGNGHPVAAVITIQEIAASFASTGVEYFNTFGGNPVSCAIGSAVLDVLEDEKLMEHALDVGNHLQSELQLLAQKHTIIGDIRGSGLFVGVDFVVCRKTREPHPKAAQHVLARLKADRILLQSDGPYNNVLKFKPPMVFNRANVHRIVQSLSEILEEIEVMDSLNN